MIPAKSIELIKLELEKYEVHFPASLNSYDALLEGLATYINDLIVHQFHLFISLLYQLDIPEDKLRNYLHENKDEQASHQITRMIIERQLQKIEARNSFAKDENIPAEDSW